MKLIAVLFILLPFISNSQIYVEPKVNLSLAKINFSSNDFLEEVETNLGHEYGLGIETGVRLTKKVRLGLGLEFNNAINKNVICHTKFAGDGGPCETLFHNIARWNIVALLDYDISEKLSIGLGGHLIRQPFVNGNFIGINSRPYKTKEQGISVRISYLIKKISISALYYHGLSKQNGNFIYENLEPFQTFGLRLGYRFQLLDN